MLHFLRSGMFQYIFTQFLAAVELLLLNFPYMNNLTNVNKAITWDDIIKLRLHVHN